LHYIFIWHCPASFCLCITYSYAWSLHYRFIYICTMGWLRSVGSIKVQVSFAKYRLFCRFLLQNRHIILSILLTEATPYIHIALSPTFFCLCVTYSYVWSLHTYSYTHVLHTYGTVPLPSIFTLHIHIALSLFLLSLHYIFIYVVFALQIRIYMYCIHMALSHFLLSLRYIFIWHCPASFCLCITYSHAWSLHYRFIYIYVLHTCCTATLR
jgi:hypothetical protein